MRKRSARTRIDECIGDFALSRRIAVKKRVDVTFLWQAHHPNGNVIRRDLNASRIPYMDNDWIAGVYAPPDVERTPEMQKGLALSAELIAELQAADVLFISTPMYNFTIPAGAEVMNRLRGAAGLPFRLAPGWPAMRRSHIQKKPINLSCFLRLASGPSLQVLRKDISASRSNSLRNLHPSDLVQERLLAEDRL